MRREVDIERVRALAAASGGRVGIVTVPKPGHARFVLDLGFVTAGSPRYPAERRTSTRLAIELAPRHPFQPPSATVLTPVFHPHVFPSGLVCIGAKWLPSEGMDLFVQRIVRLLAYDPLLMNPQSVAHGGAQLWYQRALLQDPAAFPTDAAAIAAMGGAGDAVAVDRVVVRCPACASGLRLPAGRAGSVRCPRCGASFETAT
jgi:hypothetical protein